MELCYLGNGKNLPDGKKKEKPSNPCFTINEGFSSVTSSFVCDTS